MRTNTKLKVVSISQTRPAKGKKTNAAHGTFKGNIELKMYYREDYDSMSMGQQQQLYKLQQKAGLLKGKKTPEGSMLGAKTDNTSNGAYLQMKN